MQNIISIDARKKDCPLPVIQTKKALQHPETKTVVTLVDNQIAVENLAKMANQLGFLISSMQIQEDCFQVSISKSSDNNALNEFSTQNDSKSRQEDNQGCLVVFSSEFLGTGNEKLGAALMKSFLYTLAQSDVLPDEMIFYNGAIKLCCEKSTSLLDLQTLSERGVKLFCCGACLNFYELSNKLKVGETTNMMEIIDKMQRAKKLIKP